MYSLLSYVIRALLIWYGALTDIIDIIIMGLYIYDWHLMWININAMNKQCLLNYSKVKLLLEKGKYKFDIFPSSCLFRKCQPVSTSFEQIAPYGFTPRSSLPWGYIPRSSIPWISMSWSYRENNYKFYTCYIRMLHSPSWYLNRLYTCVCIAFAREQPWLSG